MGDDSENKITFEELEKHAKFVKSIKERAQDKFDEIVREERQEAELENMRKHAEAKRKVQKRARAEFDKIVQDEADKATRKDMEQHHETSRRIQSRARLEFDQIIAQHTISNNDSRRGSLESVQESEDEPAPQQVSEDLLADMKKRREQTIKIKA